MCQRHSRVWLPGCQKVRGRLQGSRRKEPRRSLSTIAMIPGSFLTASGGGSIQIARTFVPEPIPSSLQTGATLLNCPREILQAGSGRALPLARSSLLHAERSATFGYCGPRNQSRTSTTKFRWRCLVLQIGLSLPRSKVSGWLTTRNQPKNVLSYRHAALHSLGSTPAALDLRRFRVSVQETENIDFLMFSV